jgi:hypothetical protein
MNTNEIARERAQDTLDLFEDLMASVEKVGASLKHGLLDLRRDGKGSDLLPMLRAKRQADRLFALAVTIERAAGPTRILEAAE